MSTVSSVTGRNKTHLLNYYTTVFEMGGYCSPFETQSTLQKLRGALELNYFLKISKNKLLLDIKHSCCSP